MSHAKYTKEGVSLKNMINEWLMSYITSIKAKAELKVLVARRKELFNEQQKLAPVGTGINRRERAVKITESSYMAALNALNTAKMLEKNVQLTTANLTTIGEPQYPLSGTSKRFILVIGATLGSAIFIIGIYLIIELLDHTLRDPFRASRLSSLPVFSVFTGYRQKSYRGYIKACNRTTAAFTCNKLNSYLKPDQTLYINILSIDNKEGKSFIMSYMKDFWTSLGLKVETFSYETDFSTKKSTYLMARNYASLNAPKADIVLVEHPPLETCSLPSSLLKEATVNLLVANAKRAWTNSDDEYINQIKENKSSHLFMILNNVTRDVAEDFIGKIPPIHSRATLSNKIRHMALTASETSSVR